MATFSWMKLRAGSGWWFAAAITTVCVSTAKLSAAAPASPAPASAAPKVAAVANKSVSGYIEMPVNPPTARGWGKMLGTHNADASNVKRMLRGDAKLEVDTLDYFCNELLFPQFTLINENVLTVDPKTKAMVSLLPNCRQEFVRNFLNQATDRTARDRLYQLTLKAMTDIALENYHPLARYNAVLLLTAMNDPDDHTKPLKATLPILIRCLDSIDVVKLGALNGLSRHIKAGIDADQRPRLIAALLKIVSDKTVAANETSGGHDWIRRRAIEQLEALGETGPNQSVIVALAGILQDSQSSPDLSCSAARALGSFHIAPGNGVDVAALAFSIGQVAVDAYKAELARAERAYQDRPAAPSSRGYAGVPQAMVRPGMQLPGRPLGVGQGIRPGYPDAGDAAAATPTRFISVQLLKSQLVSLQRGLRGPAGAGGAKTGLLASAAGTPREQFVVSVDLKLNALILACDDGITDYETLRNQISKAGGELEALLAGNAAGGKGRQPAAPAATPADSKAGGFDELDTPAAPPAKPNSVGKIAP